MNSLRIPHTLGLEVARTRFDAALARHGISVERQSPERGTLSKTVPFAGQVRASYELLADALLVEILEAPAFPSRSTIERMVSEELQRVLA